jgi:hypothetical protein
MQSYVSTSGKPFGATGFRFESSGIVIRFKGGLHYRYTHASCGVAHVDEMKRLALAGAGLSTYVAQNQPAYADRW